VRLPGGLDFIVAVPGPFSRLLASSRSVLLHDRTIVALLGWLPRLTIKPTSAHGYGQIYVGAINRALAVVTIGLTLYLGKSDNLAADYGIAVSLTMLMTSALPFS
jgi:K+ transporter